jgi:CxxC motif-containing protein (DUF1111 family)
MTLLRIALAGALALAGASLAILAAGAGTASLRDELLAIPLTPDLGGAGTRPVSGRDAFKLQMPNSPKAHQRPFSFGNRLFNTNWVEAPGSVKAFDGLGPLFNRVSCSGCHTHDGRGSPPADGDGPMDSMLIRLSVPGNGPHGGPNPHPAYGDQLSERATLGQHPEGRLHIRYREVAGSFADGTPYALRMPRYAITGLAHGELGSDTMLSPRIAPAMIGLGLLQAVPAATLEALADPGDRDGDGISGRVNRVWDVEAQALGPGRFGWKANQPNLRQQNAAAARGDIGLTTPVFPGENCTAPQTACRAAATGGTPELSEVFLQKLTLYTMTLAVPAQRRAHDTQVKKGEALFRRFGCAACHLTSLRTGAIDGFPQLSGQLIHPFTDLLLHDMGDGLADGRPDFAASGSEWRTPPLWGLGRSHPLAWRRGGGRERSVPPRQPRRTRCADRVSQLTVM